MAKAKRKTGLDKFNKVLFILLIIAIVVGGLVIGLSSAKVPLPQHHPTQLRTRLLSTSSRQAHMQVKSSIPLMMLLHITTRHTIIQNH